MDAAELRTMWNNAYLQAGIKSIPTDNAARIMAVVYVHGNNEAFCLNKVFLADVEYIQKEYHIRGSEIPDLEFVVLLKKYSKELEDYCQAHKEDKVNGATLCDPKPKWAIDLFKERYNIKLIN